MSKKWTVVYQISINACCRISPSFMEETATKYNYTLFPIMGYHWSAFVQTGKIPQRLMKKENEYKLLYANGCFCMFGTSQERLTEAWNEATQAKILAEDGLAHRMEDYLVALNNYAKNNPVNNSNEKQVLAQIAKDFFEEKEITNDMR